MPLARTVLISYYMISNLTQRTPQRWDYVEADQNDALIARIETTVQRGHVLITVDEHPILSVSRPIIGVVAMPEITEVAVARAIWKLAKNAWYEANFGVR